MARTQRAKRDVVLRCAKVRADNGFLKQSVNAAEWNSLLTWARRGAGPQWDSSTAMWHVRTGSEAYFGNGADPKQASRVHHVLDERSIALFTASMVAHDPHHPPPSGTAMSFSGVQQPRRTLMHEQPQDQHVSVRLYEQEQELQQQQQQQHMLHLQQQQQQQYEHQQHQLRLLHHQQQHQYQQQPQRPQQQLQLQQQQSFNVEQREIYGYAHGVPLYRERSVTTPHSGGGGNKGRTAMMTPGQYADQAHGFYPAPDPPHQPHQHQQQTSPGFVYLQQPSAGPSSADLDALQVSRMHQQLFVQHQHQQIDVEEQQQRTLHFHPPYMEYSSQNLQLPSVSPTDTSSLNFFEAPFLTSASLPPPIQQQPPPPPPPARAAEATLLSQQQQQAPTQGKRRYPVSAFHRQGRPMQQVEQHVYPQQQQQSQSQQLQQQPEKYDGFLRQLPRARLSRKPLIHHPADEGASERQQHQSPPQQPQPQPQRKRPRSKAGQQQQQQQSPLLPTLASSSPLAQPAREDTLAHLEGNQGGEAAGLSQHHHQHAHLEHRQPPHQPLDASLRPDPSSPLSRGEQQQQQELPALWTQPDMASAGDATQEGAGHAEERSAPLLGAPRREQAPAVTVTEKGKEASGNQDLPFPPLDDDEEENEEKKENLDVWGTW